MHRGKDDQFHYEIVGADIIKGADVGMAYRCDGARLLLEPVESTSGIWRGVGFLYTLLVAPEERCADFVEH